MNFNHKHNSGFLRGAVAVLAFALGAALLPSAGEKASAGGCRSIGGGTHTCSGAANPASDTGNTATATSGQRLVITTEPGFGMNVMTGNALRIVTSAGATGLEATFSGPISSRGRHGIDVFHVNGEAAITLGIVNAAENGLNFNWDARANRGDLTVNATGAITAGGSGISATYRGTGSVGINSVSVNAMDDGIYVSATSSSDSVTINAMGDITSGARGIHADHAGRGALSIFLAPNANIMTTGLWGIDASANTVGRPTSAVTGGMDIMVMGNINASGSTDSSGILAIHDSKGDVSITVDGAIYSTGSRLGRGIDARLGANASDLTINVNGDITSVMDDGIATDHGGTGDVTVNIAPGASVNAGDIGISVSADSSEGDIILDIEGMVRSGDSTPSAINIGTGNSALVILRASSDITGSVSTASSNSVVELAAATVPTTNTPSLNLGQLSGFDTVRKTGPEMWEITGGTVNAEFSLDNGALSLDENADVTINANFAGNGGRLVLSANFASDGALSANSGLFIDGDVTGSTPVDLRISGNPNAAARIDNIITVTGTNSASSFTAGAADSGIYAYGLNYSEGAWSFVRQGSSATARVIESYAATLAELSSLPSLRQRLEGRIWSGEKEGIGVWGRVEGAVSKFEPGASTANSEYEIQDTRIRFGADLPLEEVEGLTLGGNVWFGLANTDVSPGDGEIETTGYSVAATATMEHSDFYVDGQFQYALFSSDLSSSNLSASGSDATAFSASGELGYRYPLGDFHVTPQAQVTWVTADFDDFRNSRGSMETASLEDGSALTGRVGVFVDKELKLQGSESELDGETGKGNVYAGLNLLVPLDGETVAKFGADNLTSELEEIAGELNIGGSYKWDDKRSVFGEAAVSLGSEITEYRANIGLRFGF